MKKWQRNLLLAGATMSFVKILKEMEEQRKQKEFTDVVKNDLDCIIMQTPET